MRGAALTSSAELPGRYQPPQSYSESAKAPEADEWFGHPRGLIFLCLTGMWEVVALFGMKSILVFYLVRQLHFGAATAVQVFGISTALSYLLTLPGGAVGDRFLGLGRAVVGGSLLLATGHFMLIAPAMLFPSLFLIAAGAGLFRPAVVGQVWLLYPTGDPRSVRALVFYKLACNIAGVFAPLLSGALYEFMGWTWAVAFSGSGMLLAIAFYALGRRYLPRGGARPAAEQGDPVFASTKPRRQTLLLVAVGVGGTLHWTIANQIGGTIALWALQSLDRTVRLGATTFTIPAAWFQSINPLLICLFTPLVVSIWARRDERFIRGTAIARMAIGSLLLTGAFVILAFAAWRGHAGAVSWVWLAVAITPMTLGELYLDPMGQAVFSKSAPAGSISTFMSLWLLTIMLGYLGAGWLGDLWIRLAAGPFFAVSALIALVSAVVLLAARSFAR